MDGWIAIDDEVLSGFVHDSGKKFISRVRYDNKIHGKMECLGDCADSEPVWYIATQAGAALAQTLTRALERADAPAEDWRKWADKWKTAKQAYYSARENALKLRQDAMKEYKLATGQDLPWAKNSPWFIDGHLPFDVRSTNVNEHWPGTLQELRAKTAFFESVTLDQCMVWIERWESERERASMTTAGPEIVA
jgi:hypothetical protein